MSGIAVPVSFRAAPAAATLARALAEEMHRPLLRQPSAVTVDFDADPLLESLGSTDAVHAVMGELGVVAMCRLACVSRQWRDLVTSDDVAWRELARGIGLSEPPPGLTWRLAVREAWSILVGDALVVVDTYDIPSVARVMAKVDDPALGPLLLLHYEGCAHAARTLARCPRSRPPGRAPARPRPSGVQLV